MSSIVACCREGVAKRSRFFTRLGTQHSTDVLFDEWFFYGMLCSLLNELQLRMRTLDNARQFCAWPNFTRQKTELSTSLNKVAKRSRYFTQHACRALYSEKSRAFGQGFISNTSATQVRRRLQLSRFVLDLLQFRATSWSISIGSHSYRWEKWVNRYRKSCHNAGLLLG